MSFHEEREHDDSNGPDVHCTGLVSGIEDRLRRHITLSTCPVLDVHLLLEIGYFRHKVIVPNLYSFPITCGLDLRKSKINDYRAL